MNCDSLHCDFNYAAEEHRCCRRLSGLLCPCGRLWGSEVLRMLEENQVRDHFSKKKRKRLMDISCIMENSN